MENVEDRPIDNEEANLDDFMSGFDEVETTNTEVDKPIETEDVEEAEELTKEDNKELDYTPFLQDLPKHVKYKDQEIKIDSKDELITTYQKGLNYDTMQEKYNNIKNSEILQYHSEKARKLGYTDTEYMQAIKEAEIQQERLQEEAEIQDMINGGVQEHIARKVVESNKIAKELQAEKLRMAEERKQQEQEAKKEAETLEFFKAFPDVKINEIPKEVIEKAKESNLKTAYTEYKYQELQKELIALKQQEKNKQTSPNAGVTQHGGVVKEKVDPFLAGFDKEGY